MTLYCGSCHVGGSWGEHDRNDRRHSSPAAMNAQGMGMAMNQFDPFLFRVVERYSPTTGMPAHTAEPTPWVYPGYIGMNPANGAIMPAASGMPGAQGWGSTAMGNGIVDGQLIMPNVKEMDCLFCHMEGYNNVMASVMTLGGMMTMAPMAGSGIMDTNSMSPTYQGYNSAMVNYSTAGAGRVVSLNATAINKIKANPPAQNCRLCHNPTSLTDLPSFMKDFLSNAPTIFTGDNNPSSPFTGLAMPSFDFNAPFGMSWNWAQGPYSTSPKLAKAEVGNGAAGVSAFSYAFIPSIGFPSAMGGTVYNTLGIPGPSGAPSSVLGVDNTYGPVYGVEIGGGNPAGTGPLYYEAFVNGDPMQGMDQNALKKSTMPFPRADWFKRGDLWDDSSVEVHYSFGCEGCHMDTLTTKVDSSVPGATATIADGKSLCDPGRGFDSAGGVEANPLFSATINSQNTVLRCENCHVTKKNSDGVDLSSNIYAKNAPNPKDRHVAFGLASSATAPKVRAIRANADGSGEEFFAGSHMDIVECTVCHVRKNTQVVRALDSTSGFRYPNMLGFRAAEGMMGMFSPGFGTAAKNVYEEWTPLFTWQKIGNGFKAINGQRNPDYRRKIYPINMITAIVWNNEDSTVDANGDGIMGREATVYNQSGTTPHAVATNYDPWIYRDMKAGMNFGPSGFAPIPVGFGGGAFQSAYAQNGSFTGAWQYVGVYGGNVIFSTPEEISGYKAWRNSIAPAVDGKSWSGTKLLYIPGPYMVTHNVRSTGQFVKGRTCTDCHAPGKEFFDGGFNITGTAIKTSAGGAFMQTPAEILQVVAHAEDLVTGAELANKAGAAREIPAEELGCWDAATKTFTKQGTGSCTTADYKHITDLDRFEALYPDTTQIVGADGQSRTPAQHKAYLLSIGTVPVPAYAANFPTTATVGQAVTLSATEANGLSGSNLVYTWAFEDGTSLTGNPVSKTFTSAGKKRVSLYITNTNTGKKVGVPTATANVYLDKFITVSAPLASDAFTATATVATRTATLNLAGMMAHTSIQVRWGDKLSTTGPSTSSTYTSSTATFTRAKHTYQAAGTYPAVVYLYNGNTLVGQKAVSIVVP